MIQEIQRLNLPLGKWQEYATKLVEEHNSRVPKDSYSFLEEPIIACSYPDSQTILFKVGDFAHFKLSFLYGCKAILISHDTYITASRRGIGLAGILQLIKERIAKDLAVKLLIATAVETNEPQQRVLKRWNWDAITKFTNPRTQHVVGFFIKHLD